MSNQRHDQSEQGIADLRLWTHAKALAAVPYLRSVLASVREHWLEMQQFRREKERLDERPGRPDRATTIQRALAQRNAEAAAQQFDDAMHELLALDVYCMDPVQGQALIPFMQSGHLAWFVFGMFESEGLKEWRFHADPANKRRVLGQPVDRSVIDALFSERRFDFDGMEQGGNDAAHHHN